MITVTAYRQRSTGHHSTQGFDQYEYTAYELDINPAFIISVAPRGPFSTQSGVCENQEVRTIIALDQRGSGLAANISHEIKETIEEVRSLLNNKTTN